MRPEQTRYFQVVGRKLPTEADPEPQIFRMRLFAPNEVTAKSRFWYFLHKLNKLKKTTGEILAVNEVRRRSRFVPRRAPPRSLTAPGGAQIFEKKTLHVKNYGIWLRYNSRSGTHNMYKQFRATTLCDAVDKMYQEMSGRHRARNRSIQVIKAMEIKSSDVTRPSLAQFIDSKITFPLPHRVPRPSSKKYRTTFKAQRPSTYLR